MKQTINVIQIAFTYIGTIVGAGFATGQEILQFFTSYGYLASFTIGLATGLFMWLGTKLMILSYYIQARSYEDMNRTLLGNRTGKLLSVFMITMIICVNSVMLAGAGSIFTEHIHIPYQLGLLLTLLGAYWFVCRGITAIMRLNSIVVPIMLLFTAFLMIDTLQKPGIQHIFFLETNKPWYITWASPFLYSAFNLALAQVILVPLGAAMPNPKVIRLGGYIGGLLIGIILLVSHFSLAVHMPNITQFDIPMAQIASYLGAFVQFIYLLLIFSEIMTTFIADVYGVVLQLQQQTRLHPNIILLSIMIICFLLSQFGFRSLVSSLYPIFGMCSLVWIYFLIRTSISPNNTDPLHNLSLPIWFPSQQQSNPTRHDQ